MYSFSTRYSFHTSSTNTHVPSPPWAAVSPVVITLSSCNRAADILIDWFGPYELKNTVGGERWWQVRGLDGVDGEWISGKDYLDSSAQHNDHGKKLSNNDRNILRMNHLETVMVCQFCDLPMITDLGQLYVHGGSTSRLNGITLISLTNALVLYRRLLLGIYQ